MSTSLGRYKLLRRLGAGGMGEVWLAEVEGPAAIRRTVVVKQVLPELAREPGFRTMFQDEARTAAALHHGNLVQLVDFEEHDGGYLLVLEYVEGVNLLELIDRTRSAGRPPLPAGIGAHVLREAARGLDHAHRRTGPDGRPLGIVHRDVAPQNLLLSFEGEVKVSDFGVARSSQNKSRTAVGLVKGTPGFLSPEQARGEPLDGRSDLFSLAATLFYATTHVQPFFADSDADTLLRIAVGAHPRPEEVLAGYPAGLAAVLERALAVRREDRYASAEELASATDEWLRASGEVTGPGALRAFLRELPAALEVTAAGTAPEPALATTARLRAPAATHPSGVPPVAAPLVTGGEAPAPRSAALEAAAAALPTAAVPEARSPQRSFVVGGQEAPDERTAARTLLDMPAAGAFSAATPAAASAGIPDAPAGATSELPAPEVPTIAAAPSAATPAALATAATSPAAIPAALATAATSPAATPAALATAAASPAATPAELPGTAAAAAAPGAPPAALPSAPRAAQEPAAPGGEEPAPALADVPLVLPRTPAGARKSLLGIALVLGALLAAALLTLLALTALDTFLLDGENAAPPADRSVPPAPLHPKRSR